MATVRFSNGATVNFDGDPTPEDIDEVADALGIQPDAAPQTGVQKLQGLPEKATAPIRGMAKTLASTAIGAAGMLPGPFKMPKAITEPIRERLQPKDNLEKAGAFAGDVASFAIPAGAEMKLAGGVEKVASILAPKIAPLLGKVIAGGTTAGAVTAAQTDDDLATKTNAIIGGAIPLFGAVAKPALRATGEKIQNVLIRPTSADFKDGFNVKNLTKYNLGGTLQETAAKVHEAITERAAKLTENIGASRIKVDLNSVLARTRKELGAARAETFGANTKLQGAIKLLEKEIGTVAKDGKVSLTVAQQIKRAVGKLGAWQFGQRDPEAVALERVANNFYTNLKTLIEKGAKGDVASINKELSELIPIENAIIRRLPVAERNAVMSLSDLVAAVPGFANPANLWLVVLNRMLKSGTAAKKLIEASKPEAGGLLKAGALGIPKTEQDD